MNNDLSQPLPPAGLSPTPSAEPVPPAAEAAPAELKASGGASAKPGPTLIQWHTPSELIAYEPPPGQNMVGDYHLQPGAISVLAGPAGCGKSLAALLLGILGAHGSGNWFGKKIHGPFRTLILQNENSRVRLQSDLKRIPLPLAINDFLQISGQPRYGLELQNPRFRAEVKARMRYSCANLLVIDPWNACVRDVMETNFQEALSWLREILAESPGNPACLIIHHFRKPTAKERPRGRQLVDFLSGSNLLASVARSVMVMQPVSDDPGDGRVVFTTVKHNDGQAGPRTAWQRSKSSALFLPLENFNFEQFDSGEETKSCEPEVQEEHLIALFDYGNLYLPLDEAVERLQERVAAGPAACRRALKLKGGKFSHILEKQDDLIGSAVSGSVQYARVTYYYRIRPCLSDQPTVTAEWWRNREKTRYELGHCVEYGFGNIREILAEVFAADYGPYIQKLDELNLYKTASCIFQVNRM